jgi:hypothetical protein
MSISHAGEWLRVYIILYIMMFFLKTIHEFHVKENKAL